SSGIQYAPMRWRHGGDQSALQPSDSDAASRSVLPTLTRPLRLVSAPTHYCWSGADSRPTPYRHARCRVWVTENPASNPETPCWRRPDRTTGCPEGDTKRYPATPNP